MNVAHWFGSLFLIALLPLLAGCGDGGKGKPQASPENKGKPAASAEKQYDIKGKVVAVAAEKKAVTLDHENIAELNMMAMKMEFPVENPAVLEGIKPGDMVQGKLKAESGKHMITRLEKR